MEQSGRVHTSHGLVEAGSGAPPHVVMWIRRSHVANKKNGADELKVEADLWVGQQAQLGASGREARGGVLALFLFFCFPMIFFP
jgi:hypothetical protein